MPELKSGIQIEYEGQVTLGDEVEFESIKEPWSVYEASDGTIFRIKTFLGRAVRIRDKFHPDGKPVYLLNLGANVVTEQPGEVLKASAGLLTSASQEKVK